MAKPESLKIENPRTKKQSVISLFSGIKVTTPRGKEGDYLETLGFKPFSITSKDVSASGKRYEISQIRRYLKSAIIPNLKIQEDKFKIKYRNMIDPKFTEKYYIQTQMRPIAKATFEALREGLKKGRLNAGGPFNKALAEFYRNSLDNRKVAIMAYKEINRVDVIDFNNTKVLTELTGIIKSTKSSLEKMKQRILKNLPK